MNRDWRALHRVGQEIGLDNSGLDTFLSVTSDIHDSKLEAAEEEYDLKNEYFKFLNERVFSDQRVLSVLDQYGVSADQIQTFESGSVDIEGSFRTRLRVSYRLDELVDVILLTSLFDRYRTETNGDCMSMEKIHHLVYLVNDEISQVEDTSIRTTKTDLGMLERTGYRYTFRKVDNGLESVQLLRDKNRMVSSNIFDEEVDERADVNQSHPYEISLGSAGQKILSMYGTKLSSLTGSESHLLREWALQLDNVMREWSSSTVPELREEVHSRNSFDEKRNGSTLLVGRGRVFDAENSGELGGLAEVMV